MPAQFDTPSGLLQPQWGGPSLSGIDSAVSAETARQPQFQLPPPSSLLGHIGQAAEDIVSAPKRAFRAGVGLDPNGSSFDDLQNLGVGRVPSAWLGSALDTLADPAQLAGLAAKGVGKLAANPAVKGFMAGEAADVPASLLARTLQAPVSESPYAALRRALPEVTPTAAAPAGGGSRFDRVMAQTKYGGTFTGSDGAEAAAVARARSPIGTTEGLDRHVRNLVNDPQFPEIMQKFDYGSDFAGSGAEGMVFHTPATAALPEGQAHRLGMGNISRDILKDPAARALLPPLPQPRPDLPGIVLPAEYSKDFNNVRQEIFPWGRPGQAGNAADMQAAKDLYNQALEKGWVHNDLIGRSPDNMIWVGGKPYIGDVGLMERAPQAAPPSTPTDRFNRMVGGLKR